MIAALSEINTPSERLIGDCEYVSPSHTANGSLHVLTAGLHEERSYYAACR
jgi:hypothetical protein